MKTQQVQNIRKTRRQKIAENKQILNNFKVKFDWFYTILTILFFTGAILTYFEIFIYRKTIIDFKIPTSIWILSGLFITPFLRNFLSKYYNTGNILLQIVYNIVTWGGILVYAFMAINYYSSDKDFKKYKIEIKEKSSMAGSKLHRDERKPLVKIDYLGVEKELVFGYSQTDKVNSADSVEIVVKKGRFGYDVIITIVLQQSKIR